MRRFLEIFEVPDEAAGVIGQIVSPDEIALLEALGPGSFTDEQARQALAAWPGERVDALLRSAYKRGILLLEDESFTKFITGRFYGRLDIFAITEPEKYRALQPETRRALDEWYFNAYLKGLGGDARPTGDRVVPLSQAYEHIDAADRSIWLNRCDCRLLAGNCDRPAETCITFRNGINTMSHRGWSKPLSKEQAKEVVRRANAAGLMQTLNPDGLCNCCGDCCYLFRAQKARGAGAAWPYAESIAAFDASACVGCGQCAARCHFGAFTQPGGDIRYDPALCRGCGLCAGACPAGAITIRKREADEY